MKVDKKLLSTFVKIGGFRGGAHDFLWGAQKKVSPLYTKAFVRH